LVISPLDEFRITRSPSTCRSQHRPMAHRARRPQQRSCPPAVRSSKGSRLWRRRADHAGIRSPSNEVVFLERRRALSRRNRTTTYRHTMRRSVGHSAPLQTISKNLVRWRSESRRDAASIRLSPIKRCRLDRWRKRSAMVGSGSVRSSSRVSGELRLRPATARRASSAAPMPFNNSLASDRQR
jgi:hypothetical protein